MLNRYENNEETYVTVRVTALPCCNDRLRSKPVMTRKAYNHAKHGTYVCDLDWTPGEKELICKPRGNNGKNLSLSEGLKKTSLPKLI